MGIYQLTTRSLIIRTSDGANIPDDPANVDYQQYLQWLSDGNTPDTIPPSSVAEINAPLLFKLSELDSYIPRGLEDYLTSSGFDITKLPAVQQGRLSQKAALRAQLQK